jgi:predicted metal-dependent HD superfamily phosphohydrolase
MLEERWAALMAAIGGRDEGGAVYKAVTGAYGSGGRFYHGLEHLRRCLAELDGATPAGRPAVVEFAVWLHDLVCEPGSTANETVSAAAAECFAGRLGASPAFAGRAAVLILATRHDRPPADADTALLLDADLAVLADPWPAFAAYEAGVRREYAFVAATAYARQRRAFVRALLARERIYHSEYFRRRGEAAARRNLGRLLASL